MAIGSKGTNLLMWQGYAVLLGSIAIKIVLILLAYCVAKLAVFRLIDRLLGVETAKAKGVKTRVKTLQCSLKSTVGIALSFIVIVMVLQAVGIKTDSILATAGIAGLAIGFGAQKLVKDIMTGFIILMEDQYGVGDYVTIGTVTGTVEELGMRTTRIRDTSGKLCIIPNGDISQVCNHSRGKLLISFELAVAASSDLAKLEQVINEAGQTSAKEMQGKVISPFTYIGPVQISAANVTIRIKGAVLPQHQELVEVNIKTRIREALLENDIALA